MFHIIGSGACGFLRLHFLLKDEIPLKYKGGGPKYQNSFQTWNDDGLIWNIEELTDHERLRRVSLHDTTTNITHSYFKLCARVYDALSRYEVFVLQGTERTLN